MNIRNTFFLKLICNSYPGNVVLFIIIKKDYMNFWSILIEIVDGILLSYIIRNIINIQKDFFSYSWTLFKNIFAYCLITIRYERLPIKTVIMRLTVQHDIVYVNMLETCGRGCLFINYDHLAYTKLDVNEQHCYGVRTL